jgi:hypothetical protein
VSKIEKANETICQSAAEQSETRPVDLRWPQRRACPPVAHVLGQSVNFRCSACPSSFTGSVEDGRDWAKGHRLIHTGEPFTRRENATP